MSRQLTIPLNEILSLVHSAEDYGYGDDVLLDAFAGMCGRFVTDDEIKVYAESFVNSEGRAQGYDEEDAEEAVRACT